MKQSNWSLFGYAIGIFWSLLFAVRYLVIYPDYSQAIQFVSIGLGIMAASWFYNRQLRQGIAINKIEEYLTDKK